MEANSVVMNQWLKNIIRHIVCERVARECNDSYTVKLEASCFNRSESELDELLLSLKNKKLSTGTLEGLLAIKMKNINFLLQECMGDYEVNRLLRQVIIDDVDAPYCERLNAWHAWLLNETLWLDGNALSAPALTARAIDILELAKIEGKLVAKVEALRLKDEFNKSENLVTNKVASAL